MGQWKNLCIVETSGEPAMKACGNSASIERACPSLFAGHTPSAMVAGHSVNITAELKISQWGGDFQLSV